VYKVEYSLPPVGGGIKSKGLEIGKKINSLKKRKKKVFEDLTLLILPKDKIQLLQHNLTLFKPKIYCFIALRGRKSKILLCVATRRGEENQRQGGNKIKSRSTIYTPEVILSETY